MGKYKRLDPNTIANMALNNLIEKIPEMEANYSARMREFAVDPEAQGRYRAGVAEWISIMRLPEIRSEIRRAIEKARERMKKIVTAPRERIPVYAR